MNSYDLWWSVGIWTENFLGAIYDNVGDYFNRFMMLIGFILLVYWLIKLNKYNQEAANNPNQIK